MLNWKKLWVLSLAATLSLGLASSALAKKPHPADPPPDDATKDDDIDTGKAKAKEFEKGKDLDKSATESKLGKLTGQVSDLDKALKASGDAPAPTKGRRGRGATTLPATTQSTKKGADAADKDKLVDDPPATTGKKHHATPVDPPK